MHGRPLLLGVGLALSLFGCAQRRTTAAPPDARPDTLQPPDPATPVTPSRTEGGRVRPPALAGSWYPAERALVIAETRRLLRATEVAPRLVTKPLALVVPHAGWNYSGAAAMAAYRSLKPGDFARVVLVGPAHTADFSGFSLSDVSAYATPLGPVPLCPEAVVLRDGGLGGDGGSGGGGIVRHVPGADSHEHSLEIQLPLLQARLGSFCLIPIVAGRTDPRMEQELGQRLHRLHDGRTLFVFSSDFVHYGARFDYTPFGRSLAEARPRIQALEEQAIGTLEKRDADGFRKLMEATGATICGRHPLSVLLEFLRHSAPRAEPVLLAHYGSPDLPDAENDNGVWYVALAYGENSAGAAGRVRPMGVPSRPEIVGTSAPPLDRELGQKLVTLARATLSTELEGTRELERELDSLPPRSALDRVQAVFVTLTQNGSLRGCVGQVEPEYWLPQAVVQAAVDAALHDSRFAPVTREELPRLSVEVTVLSPPHPIGSWQEIVLGRDGIVLEKNRRRALFLPQVPGEQGWNLTQTLDALAHKAGLGRDSWRAKDARFWVFTGQKFQTAAKPEG